jgi:hypothetical protein
MCRLWERHHMNDHNEFEFEVEIVATVGVRALSESHAREVVFLALGAPSTQEIALANAGNLVSGKDASIVAVDFTTDPNSAGDMGGETCAMGRSHCCNTASHNRSGSLSPAFAISISFCATTLLTMSPRSTSRSEISVIS